MLRRRLTAAVAAGLALGAPAVAPLVSGSPASAVTVLKSTDWRTYGGGAQHDFVGTSTITKVNVQTLKPKWFFPTGDSVTANPVKVGNVIYVGSWDGNFYAIDATTGKQRWKFTTDRQPAVHPNVGEGIPARFGDIESDGGMITASAWYEPRPDSDPNGDEIIFASGYTLYEVRAVDGMLLAKRAYPGTGPNGAADPDNDGTRIFSSPIVVGDQVLFGVAVDGQDGEHGYLQSANLADLSPRWTFDTDVATLGGQVLNDGCGSVWSSPTYDPVDGTVIASTSDCDFRTKGEPLAEAVFSVKIDASDAGPAGTLAWKWQPPRLVTQGDVPCDFDFGATVNYTTSNQLRRNVAGIGGKDGTYYVLDATTGQLLHSTNVVFGGEAGGFIGTTAADSVAGVAYGATSIGDFPAHIAAGIGPNTNCALLNPNDNAVQEPSLHAINLATGKVLWQQPLAESFGPTTEANGLVYSAASFMGLIEIHDAQTGALVKVLPVPALMSASGIVVSGNSLYYGAGVFLPGPKVDGVYAWTTAL